MSGNQLLAASPDKLKINQSDNESMGMVGISPVQIS